MPYDEYLSWIRYSNKNGPLDAAKRLDSSIAFTALNFASAMFKKKTGEPFKLSDFSLWIDKEEDKYGSVDDVFNLLSSIATKGQTDGA